MKVVFTTIIFALMLFIVNTFGEEKPNSNAHRLYLTAYETMKSADYLKEKGLDADAADMYMEALKLYQQIAEQYPDWQPDLVAYRIDYCRRFLKSRGQKGNVANIENKKFVPKSEPLSSFSTNYNKVMVGPWRIEASVKEDNEPPALDTDKNYDVSQKKLESFDPIEEMIFEAKKAERTGDYLTALGIYQHILERKVNGEILKGALRASIRIQDRATCKKILEISKKSNIVYDAELKYLYGLAYCLEQNFVKAVGVLQEASMQDPTNPLVNVALGVALAGCGKYTEAENQMRKALTINSRIAEAYYNLAWIRLALKGKAAGGAMRVDYQNALKYGADPDPLLERSMP